MSVVVTWRPRLPGLPRRMSVCPLLCLPRHPGTTPGLDSRPRRESVSRERARLEWIQESYTNEFAYQSQDLKQPRGRNGEIDLEIIQAKVEVDVAPFSFNAVYRTEHTFCGVVSQC